MVMMGSRYTVLLKLTTHRHSRAASLRQLSDGLSTSSVIDRETVEVVDDTERLHGLFV